VSGLVAHSGGLGWDELLLFASPVVVLVILQVVGRRKARHGDATEQDGPDGGEDE
jgi:hypothetical protein